MLPTSAGVEPTTSWSPVGRRIQLSHRGRLISGVLIGKQKSPRSYATEKAHCQDLFALNIRKWTVKRKSSFEHAQNGRFQIILRIKYNPGICSLFIYSVVSNDSVTGQRRPWSDCADAQSDLGLAVRIYPKTPFRIAGPNEPNRTHNIENGPVQTRR